MTETPLLVECADGVLTLTLNRPDKLNAFNADLHRALAEALGRADAAPCQRHTFCSLSGISSFTPRAKSIVTSAVMSAKL